jgi:hypothetical protein
MRHYAQQLAPVMEVLAKNKDLEFSPNGDYFERALYRASLQYFLKTTQTRSQIE